MKRSSERLPGRKGFGKDLVYTPITFREFLRSMKIDVEGKAMEELLFLSLEELKTLQFRYPFLEGYFLKFLNTGGFPKAIDDFLREGKISEITKRIYRDFVVGDAEKYLKSRTNILEIFRKLPDIIDGIHWPIFSPAPSKALILFKSILSILDTASSSPTSFSLISPKK